MKQVIIAYNTKKINAKLCDTIFSRTLGLMLSKPRAAVLKADKESIAGTTIHTLFMRFPLDVIWLNEKLEIVDFKKNVKPYKFLIAPEKKAMYVVELPADKDRHIQTKKRIEFLNNPF